MYEPEATDAVLPNPPEPLEPPAQTVEAEAMAALPFIFLPTTLGLSAPMGLAVAILPGFLRRRNIPFSDVGTPTTASRWSCESTI